MEDVGRAKRMTAIFAAMGVFLPVAPRVLGFPHDDRYCLDVRLGDDVCAGASLILMGAALVLRCATLRGGVPFRWRSVAILLGVFFLWILLPAAPLPYWHW